MVGEGLGMVPFAGAAKGDIGKVLVDGVDAQGKKPVGDAFHVLEAQVPAAGAIGLAKGTGVSHLAGGAGQFDDRAGVSELGMGAFVVLVHQDIDSRPLMPGVHGHIIGDKPAVGPFVFPVMAGEFQIIVPAILIEGLGPAVDEQFRQQLVIIVPQPLPVADRLGEAGQVIE
ncbi:MAG: hypothetical protein BWY71_02240 [Planctomycetes bacterium ADurb.Bin412]|nr:MAG: hypothetical protein BWY71_02240 [Planctomycetes bacterium ADurb.Bin412]